MRACIKLSADRVRTADRLLGRTQLGLIVNMYPSRLVPRFAFTGLIGEEIDLANVRVGRGGELNLSATLRPMEHLNLEIVGALQWLNVKDTRGDDLRLFTAQVQRLKAVYNASARLSLRLIGQYVWSRRDPSLYGFPVPRRDGRFSGSALFTYRLNWQTALYLGYGDDRALNERADLVRTGRQLFAKASYAFQR